LTPFFLAILACGGEPDRSGLPNKLPDLPDPVVDLEPERGTPRDAVEFTLVLTGELRGEIEPCGCPTLPFGGFERRQALLERVEAEGRPVFQIDAGEALLKGLVADTRGDTTERADLIGELMDQVGVQTMVVGPTDVLTLGDDLDSFPVPLVSATLEPWPAFRVLEQGGVRVGVIGLSAAVPDQPPVDAVDAARAALEQVPAVDLVIAVGNLDEQDARRVADQVQGLALVVNTRGNSHDPPEQRDQAMLIELPDRGRYLSVLRVRVAAPGAWPVELPDDRALRDWLDLAGRQARSSEPMPTLDARRVQLEPEIAAAYAGRNVAWLEEIPLGSDLDPQDAAVTELLTDFRDQRLSTAQQVASRPTARDEVRYVSSAPCVSCHRKQMAYWAHTPHSEAYRSLARDGREQDPECLECHSTGFGEPGGYGRVDASTLRAWGGVQCEMCHGPLAGHPNDANVQPTPVTEQTCLRCHDAANSPDFDYATYALRATCPPSDDGPMAPPQ
jgi:hypothetical protein